MGWSTKSNATIAEVKVGDTIYGQEGKNIDLYAVFANQYTVTYNTNGGEGGPPYQETKISGVDYTISTLKPRREGRVFLGWSTNPSATTPDNNYAPGSIYAENKNLELYAVWTNQTVKITYNTKGGSVVPSQEKAIGATIRLEGTPRLAGSTFVGWSTSPTGRTPEYQPGSDYSEDVNKTLYAIWDTTTYRITYNGNGGDLPSDLQNPARCTKTYGLGYLILTAKPTREGYNFIGWSTNPSDLAPDKNYAPGSLYTEDKDLNLYAVWEGEQYSIVYDANGGTNAPETQTTTKNNNITITNSKPIREGYEFQGWSTNIHAEENQVEYRSGQTYTGKTSIRLYAVWKLRTYTITYDTNGGTPVPASQSKKYGQNIHITSTQPRKQDNYFVGWSKIANSKTVDYYTNQVYRENESVTLYAVWSVSGYYSIIYNANGGTGGPSDLQEVAIGTSTTISNIRPTRTGYTFQGWSADRAATFPDSNYSPGAIYRGSSNLELFAVWKANDQGLIINPNGGTFRGSNSSTIIPLSTNASTTIETPTPPTGYFFKQWIKTAGDAYIWLTSSGNYQITMQSSSATIVAQYQKRYYRITYDKKVYSIVETVIIDELERTKIIFTDR